MTQIYLDENLSEYVADALNSLSKGYFPEIEVLSTKKTFGKGTPDEELIPEIGETRGILITRDVNIFRTRMQYQLCRKHKLGVFFLKLSKGSQDHWSMVTLLVNHWREIADLAGKGKFPFGCGLSARAGIHKLD